MMTSRPTSLSDSGVPVAGTSEGSTENLNSSQELPPLISSLTECDDHTRAMSKKEKYFAEKPDKNIFMKLIHPSYHERNLQFKKIFVDKGHIDENDQFLASYSCAYQREILAQGRMFISQFNVCFYANIIGWETHLVIPMKEIKLVKKMKAAFIFPNSIQIERDSSEKYFFASFINRDKSFQVLTTAHEKVVQEGKAMTREEVWDMVYNSEDKNSQNHSPPDGSTPASTKNTSTENMTALSSRSLNGSISRTPDPSTLVDKDSASQSSTSTTSDFHEEDVAPEDDEVILNPECPCPEHVGRLLLDKEYNCSQEKLFQLLFTENPFQVELNQKGLVAEYVAATWVRDHRGENSRTCAYTVSLTHSMAPKAIIVNETQVLTHYPNPRHGFILAKETQNSGVPYAENFTVNCKYCVSRTGPNSCKVKVHGGLVYKKGVWSMIKTFIEKGTYGGLVDHYTLLDNMLEEYLKKNPDTSSIPPASIFPSASSIEESVKTESSRSQQVRQRTSQKSAPGRLLAGGETAKPSDSAHLVDPNFAAEMRPRTVAELSPDMKPTAAGPSEYKPFLITIIVLLAAYLFANLYIMQGFRGETQAVGYSKPKEENLGEMMSVLMKEIRELKQKVETMQNKN